jgi:hypothetical protein
MVNIKKVLGQNFHRQTIVEDDKGELWVIIQGWDKVNRFHPWKPKPSK